MSAHDSTSMGERCGGCVPECSGAKLDHDPHCYWCNCNHYAPVIQSHTAMLQKCALCRREARANCEYTACPNSQALSATGEKYVSMTAIMAASTHASIHARSLGHFVDLMFAELEKESPVAFESTGEKSFTSDQIAQAVRVSFEDDLFLPGYAASFTSAVIKRLEASTHDEQATGEK